MVSPARIAAEQPVQPDRPHAWADRSVRLVLLASLGAICWATFSTEAFLPLVAAARQHRWSALLERPSVLWAGLGTLMLVFRSVMWMRYRPDAPATHAEAPRLTVVIPAYNEGAMVERAIDSAVAADYPAERLEVFVVDDGSTDDTWEHIQRAVARHPERVTPLRLPRNQGKRAALAEGFRRARGEVLVTVDSDSIIEPGALLALAGPFRQRKVGAVAGKVAVLNREGGLIPRMLAIQFVLSFDLLRAVQSTYRSVYCCPGALTAYRASMVQRVLERWLAQSFLGARCTFGEDRALTNFCFAEGYEAVYQRSAVVRTVVPQTYSRLCKMFLRWDRSYVREELRYATILWRRSPGAMAISLLDLLVNNLRYPIGWASLALLIALVPTHPMILLRLLFAIGLYAAFHMLFYVQSEKPSELVYGVLYAYFSFFAMTWIFPYAILTVRTRGWLTR